MQSTFACNKNDGHSCLKDSANMELLKDLTIEMALMSVAIIVALLGLALFPRNRQQGMFR